MDNTTSTAATKDDLKLELDAIIERRVQNISAGSRARGRNPAKFAACKALAAELDAEFQRVLALWKVA